MHKTELIGTTLAGIILIYGCSTANESNKMPLPELSPTSSPQTSTSTLEPSPTVQPTTEADQYVVDSTKAYNVPQTYDYFINHLDEFYRLPDPQADINEFWRVFNGPFNFEFRQKVGRLYP